MKTGIGMFILPPAALLAGALVALGWQSLPHSTQEEGHSQVDEASSAHATGASPKTSAPSQLQAVLHGPRHRVQDLTPLDYDDTGETAASIDLPSALAFPLSLQASQLVEHAQAPRRWQVQAEAAREGERIVFTLKQLNGQPVQPGQQRSWSPGAAEDDPIDRVLASIARTLMALDQELADASQQRQAWQAPVPSVDGQQSANANGQASDQAQHAAVLLLPPQAVKDQRYRVLSYHALDEIMITADGGIRWLQSRSGQSAAPAVHQSLSIKPLQGAHSVHQTADSPSDGLPSSP